MANKSLVTYDGNEIQTSVGKVLVRLNKPEEVTKGGIIIPNTAKKETDFTGTIVATSRGLSKEFSLGDNVIVLRHAGMSVPTDDEKNTYKQYKRSEILYYGF